MLHFNIYIEGKVQGVGFRYFAYELANTLGVTGFVKNLYDGRVYVEAEAEDATLMDFVKMLRKGSGHAYVKNVSYSESVVENFSSFEIRR